MPHTACADYIAKKSCRTALDGVLASGQVPGYNHYQTRIPEGANMHILSRRELLKRAALAAGGAVAAPMLVPATLFGKHAPSNRLSLAVIGLGGQGGSNLKAVKDQNLIALCDVDYKRAGKAF